LLPFVFFVMYMVWKSRKKLKAFWQQEPLYSRIPVNDELNDFPARMIENNLQFENDDVGAASPPISNAATSAHKSTTQSSSGQGQDSNYGSGGQIVLGDTSDEQ